MHHLSTSTQVELTDFNSNFGIAIISGRKKYTPPPWKPSFFPFQGLRLYGVYPSFRTYGVYPFPLFSQENGIHHSGFCSVTSGSGDRPRKEGCHSGGVYSFFPCHFPKQISHWRPDGLYYVSIWALKLALVSQDIAFVNRCDNKSQIANHNFVICFAERLAQTRRRNEITNRYVSRSLISSLNVFLP